MYKHICICIEGYWHIKLNTMTYRALARQRLREDIPAGAKARNNRTAIARQRISKHASLTIEAVFPAWSVQSC
jgi:hypothetical protein